MKNKNLKALIESRNAKLDEMDKVLAAVKTSETETRAFTDEELEQFETLKSEVEKISKQLQLSKKLINYQMIIKLMMVTEKTAYKRSRWRSKSVC